MKKNLAIFVGGGVTALAAAYVWALHLLGDREYSW